LLTLDKSRVVHQFCRRICVGSMLGRQRRRKNFQMNSMDFLENVFFLFLITTFPALSDHWQLIPV
jgi:hypothetical protein